FALVYLDPMNEQLPQMAMGDFLAYPAAGAYFDPDGNLYIGDFDWSRMLIYKKPFKNIIMSDPTATASPTFTPTPTATATITLTPTATPRSTDTVKPLDTSTPIPTSSPANYFELRVVGEVFHSGDRLTLKWEADPDRRFNLMGRSVAVYFGAAERSPVTDRPATVSEIISSGSLYLFSSNLQSRLYNPDKLAPTYPYVIFPLNGTDTSGSVSFNLPSGIEGTQWVFFAACVDVATGQFVSLAYPVEVSNEARVK
ncbi:MAG: hypothetical protein NTX71_07485, partial [Candidatus Aureabacteria bacterium]|nr:hypothetical protein [Candidatus Auribacterota bacterium]